MFRDFDDALKDPFRYIHLFLLLTVLSKNRFCAPLFFAHPYFAVKVPFSHSFVAFFSSSFNFRSLIFAQGRWAKIKGTKILIGIR